MCPSMKRQGMVAMVVLAALVLMAGNAWAQARKTGVTSSVSTAAGSEGDVVVDYLIKGVGNDDLCVVVTVTFTADCACQNNGGNCPSDAKKKIAPITRSVGQVDEPRNGQISGEQIVQAPGDADCAAALGSPPCQGNQHAILAELSVGTPITVQLFTGFTPNPDGTCTPTSGLVRTETSTPSPDSFTFDEECAALFE